MSQLSLERENYFPEDIDNTKPRTSSNAGPFSFSQKTGSNPVHDGELFLHTQTFDIILHMSNLPTPPKESVIYEDEKLYVALASYPITKGHTVVVWKKRTEDIKALSCDEYDYLMNMVDVTRDTLLKVFNVEKVYMLYMDETKEVHWHLIPRYDEKGFDIFRHEPEKISSFPSCDIARTTFKDIIKNHKEFSEINS